MAVAGSAVPVLRVRWTGSHLVASGGTRMAQVSVVFSRWGGGCGTLDDAARELVGGAEVVIDARGDSFAAVQAKCKEMANAHQSA